MHWPWRAAMFKTLYKNNGVYRKPGVHRPRDADDDTALETQWFDGEGRALPDQFKTRRIFSNYGRSNYALVQLNHYPLLSAEDYVLKADRGRAVHSDQLLGLDYWTERNWNTDEDLSIARYTEARQKIQADLMQDSTLKSLHEAAATWRTQRFESLLEQEPFRALFARILMTSPSRPIPAEVARTLVQYANRGRNKDNPA
jgi:hypothetical protein